MNSSTMLYRAVALIYMAVIFAASVRPMPEVLPEVANIDKLYHFGAYSLLGFLLAVNTGLPSRAGVARTKTRIVLSASVISLFFGAFIEVCQSFTSYRSAEVADAMANGAGGVIGSLVYSWFKKSA